ncbi:MAG: polyphosphate kinase 1 [Betaproteobacteria bacterium]|nr:polyphosphate kinase 1 [Betaproteobacteria bacterium]
MGKKKFTPAHFLNRELGMLEFNCRVLAQAEDPRMPLLERLKFLCIVSNNLDEFFEVRVAGLKEQIKLNIASLDIDGLSARDAFQQVSRHAHELVARQYRLLDEVLLPALEKEGIRFLARAKWKRAQREWIKEYFFRELEPVLTPIGLDPAHPFPRVFNKSLNFAVELKGRDAFGRNSGSAIVQAPRVLPRVIRLPAGIADAEYDFVFLSSILHAHVAELFLGMRVRGCYQFRATRNSDLFVDEEEIKNLRTAIQGELPQRHFGDTVRLELSDDCPESITGFLLQQFGLQEEDVYRVSGPVNLVRLMQVPDLVDRPDLKYPPFRPGLPDGLATHEDIFSAMRERDILLHHPFQSFTPVVEFIEAAASDPNVVTIKQTVYRTGPDSALMEALIDAAQGGKEVTAVVELMARFDEEANINWAARLEEVGAHVVYGVVGHKTHAKMALVVRREGERLRRYAHLGTGNYHSRTAQLYTDFGLFTCNEEMCADVNELFGQLTGLGRAGKLKHIWQSPFTLHKETLAAIRNEAKNAKAGRQAGIIAKMNALIEPEIVSALYGASQAGVPIQLVVRGVCTLRPGIKGLSENISVRSIVGRFLEHSRIFCFFSDGEEEVYLSSADWMDRNFFRRVETCFPVLDKELRKRVVREGLEPYMRDNCQAWDMDSDGGYHRKGARRGLRAAQDHLLNLLAAQ